MPKMNADIDLTLSRKPNSKWIIDLNVKHKPAKLPENNIENLDILGFGDEISGTTPKAQSMNERIELISWTLLT